MKACDGRNYWINKVMRDYKTDVLTKELRLIRKKKGGVGTTYLKIDKSHSGRHFGSYF